MVDLVGGKFYCPHATSAFGLEDARVLLGDVAYMSVSCLLVSDK